jgi:hypothetical protein
MTNRIWTTTKAARHGIATAVTRLTRRKRNPRINPCLGVPVEFDEKMRDVVSEARGLWRWKKIVIGPSVRIFSPAELEAILLHEVGHCKARHLERRIAALWLLFFNPKRLRRLCVEQEFEADSFVAMCGKGPALASAFMRLQAHGRESSSSALHPSLEERIKRLSLTQPFVQDHSAATTRIGQNLT